MTINDYENQGGFIREFATIREIGQRITMLKEAIPARPHREPEMEALAELSTALDRLRMEVGATRNE